MIRKFLKDERGNYAILTAAAMVPIMGALALAIDYAEISRQREVVRNSLDAAGMAVARRILDGSNGEPLTDAQLKSYAADFFNNNLGSVKPANAPLKVTLPNNNFGGGMLEMEATLTYKPYFLPVAAALLGKTSDNVNLSFVVKSGIRLQNTIEVALVLDNSKSMENLGSGTGQRRIDLLRAASTQLVARMAEQASAMRQINEPVRFGVVPFAASVNIAPDTDSKPWLDTDGLSPIHHENFDWSKMTRANMTTADIAQIGERFARYSGGAWVKDGTGWGPTEGGYLTRFSLYQDILAQTDREAIPNSSRRVCKNPTSGTCNSYTTDKEYQYTVEQYTSWQGCVEARPTPYNNDDTPATKTIPATLFVPMFAPDEAGHLWRDLNDDNINELKDTTNYGYKNSWWADWNDDKTVATRQADMRKYFRTKPFKASAAGDGYGPNFSCTTTPVTPLTDVTTAAGRELVENAINAMQPGGNTNVPEGTAWGWRVVSSGAPFTEGRPDGQRGNDKVIIVLTDGANTYSPASGNDGASNKSTYAAYGYAGRTYASSGVTRIFKDTSSAVSKTTYTQNNFQAAMDENLQKVCANAKGTNARKADGSGSDNVIVMTVSLDLSASKSSEKKAIDAMTNCASYSRTTAGKKLFWNATGANLMQVFQEIADELSNLRIVS
ncbi:TadE/TadG family type IV pilus assembly protein [Aminobacter sp. AP02]|uniref:TadE/TadG family type IV pilus assembly protein n=1 Tax=Aminobacter sp. AP02 TaxID=2135737 RepID=UPI000D6A9B10|nr:TadE/TadG family type IV pilus assembly protein [Aminobacter sp. AP02]PWK75516.1 Flp pilus assembly protein TadG [Aminobacter sp. AP02]